MSTKAAGSRHDTVGESATRRPGLVMSAWIWDGVALLAMAVGALTGPEQGGSAALLVAVLTLVAVGLVSAVAALVVAVRGLRAGRSGAIAPLLVGIILVLQGSIVLLGTVGRFQGWNG